MLFLQVTGNATIAKSKSLTDAEKEQVMQSEDGSCKAISTLMIDADGNKVNLGGKIYISKSGSLTSRFTFQIKSFEIVEVDLKKDKSGKEKDAAQELRSDLGL